MKERKVLFQGSFCALFDDGGIGYDDGVGYLGEESDVKGLYLALKKFFEAGVKKGEAR